MIRRLLAMLMRTRGPYALCLALPQVIPLYDNCAGSVPLQKHVDWFACEDSDPRSAAGDCVLYQDGAKYNLCVLAERR